MHTVVEVGDWEHECCGPSYERDTTIELTCVMEPSQGGVNARYVESHHELSEDADTICVRGRVADIHIRHLGGLTEQIEHLPSGRALRGFDDHDDGHLEKPWTGEPVVNDSSQYLITIAG